MIHVATPYSTDKNLGAAYNNFIKLIPEEDWICLIDYDVLFLLPQTISHFYKYIELYPECDLFTCYANRSHENSRQQLLAGKISSNADMYYHIDLAKKQESNLYKATELKGNISGFLMILSKKLWNEIKFIDNGKSLGVDTDYSNRLAEKDKRVYRMDGVYVWHTYRLINGVNDKSHLK